MGKVQREVNSEFQMLNFELEKERRDFCPGLTGAFFSMGVSIPAISAIRTPFLCERRYPEFVLEPE